jgi:hypothetical protein
VSDDTAAGTVVIGRQNGSINNFGMMKSRRESLQTVLREADGLIGLTRGDKVDLAQYQVGSAFCVVWSSVCRYVVLHYYIGWTVLCPRYMN